MAAVYARIDEIEEAERRRIAEENSEGEFEGGLDLANIPSPTLTGAASHVFGSNGGGDQELRSPRGVVVTVRGRCFFLFYLPSSHCSNI